MFDVHATEEEDKLVLLSALDRLGRCTEEQLLRYVVETQLMNQFQFFIALSGLLEAVFIMRVRLAEGVVLELTEQGRQSLSLFGGRIRASQQGRLEESGAAWRVRVREELNMPADWREEDGRFQVALRVMENGAEFFRLELTAADKRQAKRFCERWPQCATELYQHAMELLGETEAKDEEGSHT